MQEVLYPNTKHPIIIEGNNLTCDKNCSECLLVLDFKGIPANCRLAIDYLQEKGLVSTHNFGMIFR